MKYAFFIAALLSGTIFACFGQTATIKVERLFSENSYENFDSIYFDFNGTTFWGRDTFTKTINLNSDLDRCIAVIEKDTLIFLTRFKSEQNYTLKPGCCCEAFTLQAQKNASRGTVTFRNHSGKDAGIVICGHHWETVKTDSSTTIYADESAMCLFRTCSIQVVDTRYFSNGYEDENDDSGHRSAREKYILDQVWFHFLHGEEVEVIFDADSTTIELEVKEQFPK